METAPLTSENDGPVFFCPSQRIEKVISSRPCRCACSGDVPDAAGAAAAEERGNGL